MAEKTLTINLAPGRYTRDEVVKMIDQLQEAMYEPRCWYWPFGRRRERILKLVYDVPPQA